MGCTRSNRPNEAGLTRSHNLSSKEKKRENLCISLYTYVGFEESKLHSRVNMIKFLTRRDTNPTNLRSIGNPCIGKFDYREISSQIYC